MSDQDPLPYISAPASRDVLYEEVWSKPMIHLAKKYGLSDQGLRKVCVKLQIPLPTSGYWARIAAGRSIARPKLPPFSLKKHDDRARAASRQHLAEKEAATAAWRPPASPPSELELSWHKALAGLRKAVAAAVKRAHDLRRVHERNQANPRPLRRQPLLFLNGTWQGFLDRGQILLDTHGKNVFRVSLDHHERGLRLLNAIAGAGVAAGYSVTMVGTNERLQFKRGDDSITLRLAEKFEADHRKELRSWSKTWERVRTLKPTGRLTVYLESAGSSEAAISDLPGRYLDDRLEEVLAGFSERLVAAARQREKQEQWRREWEQAERVRKEQLRIEEEARRQAAEEKARRQALVAEAEAWSKAMDLRRYLSELDGRVANGGVPSPEYERWRPWAEEVARDLDKSSERVKPADGTG